MALQAQLRTAAQWTSAFETISIPTEDANQYGTIFETNQLTEVDLPDLDKTNTIWSQYYYPWTPVKNYASQERYHTSASF